SRRRQDVCDAAKRPQDDPLGLTADRATGQRVAELVQQDDDEQGKVLDQVPGGPVVVVEAELDDQGGDHQPGPMQVDGDAGHAEEGEGTKLESEHSSPGKRPGWRVWPLPSALGSQTIVAGWGRLSRRASTAAKSPRIQNDSAAAAPASQPVLN